MTFHMPDFGAGPRGRVPVAGRHRSRALLPAIVVIGVLVVGFGIFTSLYTDLLWYRSVAYSQVFTTQLWTKIWLFVFFGLLMGGTVAANMVIAYQTRPTYRALSPEQQNLERYRIGLDPFRRAIIIGVPALLGLLAGSSAAAQWRPYLLWRNATPFGKTDPQFGIDISFFAFGYPWWRFLLAVGFGMVILSLVAALITHYVYGGVRLQTPGDKTTWAARAHLSVLIGVFVLLKAVAYWLDRYGLALKSDSLTGSFAGLKYVDVNAVLPAKTILAAIAVICAVLFFVTAFRRGWLLPGVGLGLLVLSAVLIGGVYPMIVQRFQVQPSEADREAPYIQKNIQETRAAYGLENMQVSDYQAAETPTPGVVDAESQTAPGVRLLDPIVVAPTFQQLQQIKGFYSFPDALDVDRYLVDGQRRDMIVSVRELELAGIPDSQRNWINDHTVYTHGYGFVAAYGNTRDEEGRPSFSTSNIPPIGKLGDFESRVYFGERTANYSIVGAPSGSPEREIDYPDDASPQGQQYTSYDGTGGVPMGSAFRRLLYAVKYQEGNIVLSNTINESSRILYDREPRQRVEKVAPWLTIDGDPYPALVGGRIVWILDGYTTSNGYPYSARTTLTEATADTLTTTTSAVAVQAGDQVNYIRNSVKAIVDAYDGAVSLYAWDETDPVLNAWMNAFPGTVKARSQISQELLSHLRYPEDLFKVQRQLISRYHVTDPRAFYSGGDFWLVPKDPTRPAADEEQPPYYLTLRMPGEEQAAFSLTTTFVPNRRPNLAAFMAVNSDPGPNYGRIRVLQLNRNTGIPGPGQVQNNFKSDPEVAQQINLLQRGGSEVDYGNLLTLPFGNGLLYVEPVYVRASSGESYPLLRKVLVSFGNKIAFEDTLSAALSKVFGTQPSTQPPPVEQPPPDGQPSPPGQQPPSPAPNPDLARALADAQRAVQDAEEALRRGDFGAYGDAQQRLRESIDRAVRAEQAAVAPPAPTPTPAPAQTPAPGPTAAPTQAAAQISTRAFSRGGG